MGERISYARVFVEMRATKELQNKVKLLIDEGEEMEIEVEYEWLPPFANSAQPLGM